MADPNYWLWRISIHKNYYYGVAYDCSGKNGTRLYKSKDGIKYTSIVDTLYKEKLPNESSTIFLADNTAICLLRREEGNGLAGFSKPPYTEWNWKDTGLQIGGPHILQIPDGRIVAAVRLYNNKVRTSLCILDPETGTLTETLALPSGGDTSYPGLVWHEDMLYISYYSSHEGKTSIYLAKVKM